MAKKQTRRSISVSRTTYERLKAFCETNNISMSQLVETRVNDFLGSDGGVVERAPERAPIERASLSTTPPAAVSSFRQMAPLPPRAPAMPAPVRPVERFVAAAPAPQPIAAAAPAPQVAPAAPAPQPAPAAPAAPAVRHATVSEPAPAASASSISNPGVPMTSVAARFAVDPPPPIIKPRQDTAAPKPAEKRPEQIFTF